MPHRTVAQNIATVPRLLESSRKEAQARALELLEVVGLILRTLSATPPSFRAVRCSRVGVARASPPMHPSC